MPTTEYLTQAPRVTERAEQILTGVGIAANPYLTTLVDGSMTLDHFRVSQEQFGFAVTYFARPMAALISRMELPGQRLGILSNILEEHGDFKPHAFHHATFRQFLASIGSDDAERLDALVPSPQVHAFNSVLTSVCTMEDLAVGTSCLGIIEHAFAGISATIGSAVVERGWSPRTIWCTTHFMRRSTSSTPRTFSSSSNPAMTTPAPAPLSTAACGWAHTSSTASTPTCTPSTAEQL